MALLIREVGSQSPGAEGSQCGGRAGRRAAATVLGSSAVLGLALSHGPQA